MGIGNAVQARARFARKLKKKRNRISGRGHKLQGRISCGGDTCCRVGICCRVGMSIVKTVKQKIPKKEFLFSREGERSSQRETERESL